MEQTKSLEIAAAKYAELVRQIKDMEQMAAPLKQQIVEYARKVDLKKLVLGDVIVERRETLKVELNARRVNPDWLYRLQSNGYGDLVEYKLGRAAAECGDAIGMALLQEAEMKVEETSSYAVKVR